VKIFVLGGDGFCGWPAALELSDAGHDVVIIDNLSRRNIDNELEVTSLTPIQTMSTRLAVWSELTNRQIGFKNIDIARDYEILLAAIQEEKPECIVHLAEQRAAPYSMKSSFHKRYTVNNNINASNNVCAAIVESGLDVHLVHLGTMGVYGYSSADYALPEGYFPVRVQTRSGDWVEMEIVHPANPGSIYHMTKVQDAVLLQFYAKNDGLRITDLHQGIVWGTQTDLTRRDERLINRFDYDGDYGTVLNRFLMQAAVGHPLTVHGTGGQTRAFIHIRDSVRCIRLAAEAPPERGERVRILNQMTETRRIRDLALMIAEMTGAKIDYLDNPRNEAVENDLSARNDKLLALGLDPITLNAGLMDEIVHIAEHYRDRVDISRIPCRSQWSVRSVKSR
jgi:UDP-sulfoquinovose synthase